MTSTSSNPARPQGDAENGMRRQPMDEIFRPTLVLGIGGTGTLVLKRLKRQIRQKFQDSNQTDLFQLLAIDTELENLSHPEGLEVQEFLNLAETTIRGDDVIRAMLDPDTREIYKGLSAWWPRYKDGPFLPGDITHGAKATRCIGRLAFWSRGPAVWRVLDRKIANTLDIRGLRRSDISATGTTAKVFVVCSLAGGTGSGMFLDLTYMVRRLMAEKGITAFVTGLLLVDPSPFSEVIQEDGLIRRMEANVYAALTELDWLMGGHRSDELNQSRSQQPQGFTQPTPEAQAPSPPSGTFIFPPAATAPAPAVTRMGRYDMQYLDRLRVSSDERPFDVCYIVTSTNENARRLRDVSSITEMIAQEIFLEIATPLGRTGRSALDNVERLSSFSEYRARPLAYSSFAVASLNLTPRLIRERSVLWLMERSFERLLQPFEQPYLPDKAALDHEAQLPLNADASYRNLTAAVAATGTLTPARLAYTANVGGQQYKVEALRMRQQADADVGAAQAALKQALDQRIWPAVTREIGDLIAYTLSRPDVTLDQLAHYVSTLLDRVEHVYADATQQADYAAKDGSRAEAQTNDGFSQLDRALATPERQLLFLPTNRPELLRQAADVISESLNALSRCRAEQAVWQAVADLGARTRQQLRGYRDSLPRLQPRLVELLRDLRKEQAQREDLLERGTNQYQLEFEAVDAQEIDRQASDLMRQLTPGEAGRALLKLVDGNAVARRIGVWDNPYAHYLNDLVGRLATANDLPSVLFELYKGDLQQLERQLKKLVEYAEPFAQLNATRSPEVSQCSIISLVGYNGAVQTEGKSRMVDALSKVIDKYSPVDTGEPHRLIYLKTKHGLPLFALSIFAGRMRQSYYLFRIGWEKSDPTYRPIHIDQDWMALQDFNPAARPD